MLGLDVKGDVSAIVQNFLQLYQQDSTPEAQKELAKWHVAAYLEVPLYMAARDRLKAFRDYESPSVTWEHYLHLAKRLAYDPDQILPIYQRYQPEKYSLEQHFQFEKALLHEGVADRRGDRVEVPPTNLHSYELPYRQLV